MRSEWTWAWVLGGLMVASGAAEAATIDAASCSQGDVEAAMASAAVGDVVQVPAGSCSWSGLAIEVPVHLRGAGRGATLIDITGECTITKQAEGVVRLSGFGFRKAGGGTGSKAFVIGGSWRGAEPVVIEGNDFTVEDSGLFVVATPGGVVIAGNAFTGGWDDSFIQPKDPNDADGSWTSADTLGDRDPDGKANLYVEDNTFYGGTNQGIDCDDASRCVYRFNTLTYSSFNTHGWATSPTGVRHFEVYGNTFIHDGGAEPIANQNWAVWIRGGTGVIYDNQIADIAGGTWGDKAELHFSIRGAEDARPQGDCGAVTYPVPHQLGQSHDGSGATTDPIHIWGNDGAQAISADWRWGNPCNLVFEDFFEEGRDYVLGPKPGYAPYSYPHPLAGDPAGTGAGGGPPTGSGGASGGVGGSRFGAGGGAPGGPAVAPLVDDGGCGCRLGAAPDGSGRHVFLVLVAAAAWSRRRRRARGAEARARFGVTPPAR